MNKVKLSLFAPAVFGLVFGGVAFGQVNLTIVQGNGQVICDGCAFGGSYNAFDPLIVHVTDASGKPVAGATVNWAVTSGSGFVDSTATTTGSDTSASASLCTAIGNSCNNYHGSTTAGITGGLSFIQSSVTASISSGQSVVFTLTQSPNPQLNTFQDLTAQLISPVPPFTFTGTTGSTSTTPITIQVQTTTAFPVANVSVRLVPGADVPAGSASISCATAPGADPGSVLTSATGAATCTPVFGSVSSRGQTVGPFWVCIGGVTAVQNPADTAGRLGTPGCYRELGPFNIAVTSASVGAVTAVSGSAQTALQGQALGQPLVAKVTDATGAALAGQQITWTVSPANAATLSSTTSTSDANGQVSTSVTLAGTASGAVTVKATAASGQSASFTITATSPITITGLTKVSGDNPVQTAVTGALFSQPLTVQVTTTGGSPANIPVSFTISGPGALSATSVLTNASGQASVNVSAGATAGTVTVTASAAGAQPVTFTLTVMPPGPSITGNSILNGAGFFPSNSSVTQTALSPCGVGTIVNGTALTPSTLPSTTNMYAAPMLAPSGVTISFGGTNAPILNVTSTTGQQLITFQVPCELVPNSYTVTVSVNGASATIPSVPVRPAAPGIFDIPYSDLVRRAVLVRGNGSFVTLQNPARRGETVRMYITGAGPVQPVLNTASVPTPGVDSLATGQVFVGVNNSGVQVVQVRAAPDLIGVYEVTFAVPSDAPVSNNVVLDIAINAEGNPTQFSQASSMPIQ